MSNVNPGEIFDASNSWNGYNHQGKLAIFIAIKKVLEICESNDIDEWEGLLNKYFIEIEYVEDFSIGRIENGKKEYEEVHQVKNYRNDNVAEYDDGLMGLITHVNNKDTIENAYLHVTCSLNFKGVSELDYIKNLALTPSGLNKILKSIDEVRKNKDKKQKLYDKHTGRKSDFVNKLTDALKAADSSQEKLNSGNIDKALDELEKNTKDLISELKALTDEQLGKIKLYTYEFGGCPKRYCEVDKIEQLIKEEIRRSVDLFGLEPLWKEDKPVNNRYLLLLSKLDEHIIDRNLNYPWYKSGDKNREIILKSVYDWLINRDIEATDDVFFQYKLKESFIKFSSDYCRYCQNRICDECMMIPAINKINRMSFDEMKEFITLISPNNTEGLSCFTFQEYLNKDRMGDPFFTGIQEIHIPFEADKPAITYIDKETLQYILTTLILNEKYDDKQSICSKIVSNKDLQDIRRDYDYFISKDIDCPSILEESQKLGLEQIEGVSDKERISENICYPKKVGIITLDDFKNKII